MVVVAEEGEEGVCYYGMLEDEGRGIDNPTESLDVDGAMRFTPTPRDWPLGNRCNRSNRLVMSDCPT